jgi:hypothetical protein
MDKFTGDILDLFWMLQYAVLIHKGLLILKVMLIGLMKRGRAMLGSLSKRLRISHLRKIKSKRFNHAEVTYEIVKSHSFMLLFVGLGVFYLYIFSAEKYMSVSTFEALIKSFPLYVIQIMFINQRDFTRELIRRVHKIQ